MLFLPGEQSPGFFLENQAECEGILIVQHQEGLVGELDFSHHGFADMKAISKTQDESFAREFLGDEFLIGVAAVVVVARLKMIRFPRPDAQACAEQKTGAGFLSGAVLNA